MSEKMLLRITEADGHSKASKQGKGAVYETVFKLLIETKLPEERITSRGAILWNKEDYKVIFAH
jgi:hypothetical protein